MNNQFLSKQNLDSLYNFVNSNIKQETNIDLNTDGKYRVAIEKLANNFFSKNSNMNVYHLNNMVLEKVKPIILKNLHKNITSVLHLQQPSPVQQQNTDMLQGNNVDVERNFNQFTRNGDNQSVLQNLHKLESERDYNNLVSSSQNFQNKVDMAQKISEQKLELANQSRVDENNDFFKNLYENKIVSNPPDFIQQQQSQSQLPPRHLPNVSETNKVGPPIVKDPPVIEYRSDKQEFDVSNIEVDTSIQSMIKDQSEANSINFKDHSKNYQEIKDNRESTKVEELSRNALDNFYQNDSYVFERRRKRVLTVDVSNFLDVVRTRTDMVGDPPAAVTSTTPAIVNNNSGVFWSDFTANLFETFKVDKLSDVFLESVTINNPALATNFENLYLVIDIAEMNIKTNTNNVFMKDKFVIPNENTSAAGGNKIMKYHLKSNYIATVNPMDIDKLSFKITNENNISPSGLTATGVLINNGTGYSSGKTDAMTVDGDDATTKIRVGDILFNQQGQRLGTVTVVTNATSITIGGGLGEFVSDDEELYISSRASGVFVDNGAGYAPNTTGEIDVDGVNANTPFSVGSVVYLSDNSRLGTITAIKGDGTGITIGGGTLKSIQDNVQLYTAPPLAVFASNSQFNRIIMEFVFITR